MTSQNVTIDYPANPKTSASSCSANVTTRHKKETDLLRKADELLRNEIAFISNPSFRLAAKQQVSTSERVRDIEADSEKLPVESLPGLPAHLARLCDTSLLTPEEERECFRRMNYLKYRANALRSKLSLKKPNGKQITEIEDALQIAGRLRDHLIRSNTRLVMSIARKYAGDRLSFDELLSHGIASLMHAIEKFDYGRGYRFSTYATCAIRRDLYRMVMSQRKDSTRYATGLQEGLNESCHEHVEERLSESEWSLLCDSIKKMLTQLDEREQMIIALRFDLADSGDALSYSRLGERLGISKERVRQLANRALDKLRGMADEHQLSALLA